MKQLSDNSYAFAKFLDSLWKRFISVFHQRSEARYTKVEQQWIDDAGEITQLGYRQAQSASCVEYDEHTESSFTRPFSKTSP